MSPPVVTLGIAPIKRSFTDLKEAAAQKELAVKAIRAALGPQVATADLEGCLNEGILGDRADVPSGAHLAARGIDALLLLHCDFGNEDAAASLAKRMDVPVLLWGPRDLAPRTADARGSDTQCGIFATSKVLARRGVAFSYIVNCAPSEAALARGVDTFCRAAAVVKSLRGMRIAQVGTRPRPFLSVMCNEGELLERFGIEVIPISVGELLRDLQPPPGAADGPVADAAADIRSRIDCSTMKDEHIRSIAALKLALARRMNDLGCTALALECWPLLSRVLGVMPCLVNGELANLGLPVACETDVHGAICMAMAHAASCKTVSPFFADLTARHPDNDRAELLWHCGPFPWSLRAPDAACSLANGMGQWRLRDGEITVTRFDGLGGRYRLFAGQGRTCPGPQTHGTYAWLEVDDWPAWEEKFIFGPYIHHVACIHGRYARALAEAARFVPGLEVDAMQRFSMSLG